MAKPIFPADVSFDTYLEVEAYLNGSELRYEKLDVTAKPTMPEYKWASQEAIRMVCGEQNLDLVQELTANILMWLFIMREEGSKGAPTVDKRSNATA